MKKILNALFLTLLAVFTFSSCSDVPAPYDILGEGDVPGLTGDGTKENPYNIEAAQQKQDGSIAWVQGYIVGAIENVYDDKGEFAGNKASFTAPFNITSNVLIAESPDETSESKCLPVKIKNGSDLANALNLKDHPENKGGVLLIQGELSAGFGKAALINTTAAVFNNKEIGEEQGGETPGGSTTITENQPYSVSFASDLAGFTVENKVSEGLTGDVWYYSKKYTAATASSYNGSTNVPAEGWFLSPVLDMTAISKATLTFEHSSYSEGKPEELMLKVREENATSWTDLVISNYSNGRDNHVTTTVDLTAFAAKKAQIAFIYKNLEGGTNNTWYIYNLKVAAGEGGGSVDPDPVEGKLIFTEIFGSNVDANILTATTAISNFTHWDNSYSYSATTADIRAIAHRTPENMEETKKVNNIGFPANKAAEFVISGINIAGYTKFKVVYEAASNAFQLTEVDNLNKLKLTLNGKEVTPDSKEIVGNKVASGIFHEMQVEISVPGTDDSTLKFSTNGTDNTLGLRLYNIRLYAVEGEGGGTEPEPADNLLTNSGFENWTADTPDDWARVSVTSAGTWEKSTDAYNNSNYSILVKGNSSNNRFGAKEVQLEVGKYTIAVYAKIADSASAGAKLKTGIVPINEAGSPGTYNYGETTQTAFEPTDSWTVYTNTIEVKAAGLYSVFLVNAKSGSNKNVLLDDVTLVKNVE